MSQYAGVKATINANIKTNNNEEITGLILNSVLNEMVDNLAAGYLFKGIATTSTNPGTPDENVFYIGGAGTYSHFGGAVIPEDHLGVLKYNGSWSVQSLLVGKNYDEVLEYLDWKTQALVYGTEVTPSLPTITSGVQISAGKWTSQSQRRIYLVPYTYRELDKLKVTATADESAYFTFLTSDSHVVGQDVAFCIPGTTTWTEVAAGQTSLVDIPSNCAFIAINEGFHATTQQNTHIFYPEYWAVVSYYRRDVSDTLVAGSKDFITNGAVDAVINGVNRTLGQGDFIQGTNDVTGAVVSVTTRLITPNLIFLPAGAKVQVTPNGQKYIILRYTPDGAYLNTTGWITDQTAHTFSYEDDYKIRILVAKQDNSTIAVTDLAAVVTIETSLGLEQKVASLEEDIPEADTTRSNDSFMAMNRRILLYNPYKDRPTNAYKGQMHCHTNKSDGADTPANMVGKYVSAGFDFITITDHNYITPDPGVSGIVWMGDSYEDTHNTAGYQHMNVYNADAVLNRTGNYQTENTPAMIVGNFVLNGHSVVSYNHPEYAAVYASDATLEGLPEGISFVEIYNSTIQTLLGEVATYADLPAQANFGDMYDVTDTGKRYKNTSNNTTPTWTETTDPDGNLDRGFRIMLDRGRKVFCNAVDDYHRGTQFNRGWMVAFAEERTRESIWNALLSGCSYASAGVTLSDIQVKGGKISLQIADGADATTIFYGYNNEVLATITGATPSYQMTGGEKYVRAMVTIGTAKAWTQPVWVVGSVPQYKF